MNELRLGDLYSGCTSWDYRDERWDKAHRESVRIKRRLLTQRLCFNIPAKELAVRHAVTPTTMAKYLRELLKERAPWMEDSEIDDALRYRRWRQR